MREFTKLLLVTVTLALAGCTSGYADLDRIRHQRGWDVRRIEDPVTPSVAAYRAAEGASELWVYIEGDGRGWITPRLISDDPTPRQALGLRLAASPQPSAVLYLGRPCQYLRLLQAKCANRFWSLDRYGPEVIHHLNRVIDGYQRDSGTRQLVLIGYSGGGVLAALLAAERSDVAAFATIASNLSLAAWTQIHQTTPLTGSIDPVSRAPALANIGQIHFIGEKDRIVPRIVSESFMASLPERNRARLSAESEFDHVCCWAENWPRLRNAVAELVGPRAP